MLAGFSQDLAENDELLKNLNNNFLTCTKYNKESLLKILTDFDL